MRSHRSEGLQTGCQAVCRTAPATPLPRIVTSFGGCWDAGDGVEEKGITPIFGSIRERLLLIKCSVNDGLCEGMWSSNVGAVEIVYCLKELQHFAPAIYLAVDEGIKIGGYKCLRVKRNYCL